MNQIIKLSIGEERFKTRNPMLARQVLEQSTGLTTAPTLMGELVTGFAFAPPAIGEYWHGEGGIYAGLVRGENGTPDYHLIVPTDPAGQVEDIVWGAAGKNEDGATSNLDGLSNTQALCNSKHDHPAAQWAAAVEIDGHRDFYLPARHELRLCFLNTPELFSTDGWYSSSTQFSPDLAWIQDFDGGNQNGAHKVLARRAVAVRRALNPLTI